MHYQLEICANSLESALAAERGGADRIELCDNMYEGGTTPSFGLIKKSIELLTIPVFPIIRPRGGDFLFSEGEFQIMLADIALCGRLGCKGVAIGMLDTKGDIDKERCGALIAAARPMEVTFHRAFDCCADLRKGLEDIIALNCDRVLTSGGVATAPEGIEVITGLVRQAAERIVVMPGSGVDEKTLPSLMEKTGAREFHSTAKKLHTKYHKANLSGISYDRYITDEYKVRRMKQILKVYLNKEKDD